MTAEANRFPDWIRRKLWGDPAPAHDTERDDAGTRTTSGGSGMQEPVVVWEALHLMEAEVVKGRLEAEGIPAIIRAEALGQIYGLTSGGLAAADVLVPAPLADKAIAVLTSEPEFSEADFADPDAADPDAAESAAAESGVAESGAADGYAAP